MSCISFTVFKILSLCFNSLIMKCLGMEFFEFILLGIYSATWICRLTVLIKFVKILAIMSSNIPSAFSLLFFCPTLCICSLRLFIFVNSSFFLFLRLDNVNYAVSCAYWYMCIKHNGSPRRRGERERNRKSN